MENLSSLDFGTWSHSWTMPWVRWLITGLYLAVLMLICVYGLHRYWLVYLYYRHRRVRMDSGTKYSDLPTVTVQLPMFNEAAVAKRIIDAACALDYPRDRLQIQVLDDSTDESALIAHNRVEYWARRGVDIQYLHRENRTGYKAGALAAGLANAKGQLIAIFDADFVPHPDFLRSTVHHFTDARVGMVQACWDHLNRDDSLLTQSQAIFLDGHFLIEHTARNRSGRWMNFNGTGGVWRRDAIESAGGWQHDTLTEDVDLSYRAQLAGWRFIYLPQVACPAELPPEINAFKAQQHRWTKGSIQTAKKLLPTLLRSNAPPCVKTEAFFHLTSPLVYLYITTMALLFYPAMSLNLRSVEDGTLGAVVFGLSLFALGTASASVFYMVSQREKGRSMVSTIVRLPVLMSVGIGIALNNARGCIEALIGHDSAFVRTPKYSSTSTSSRQLEPLPSNGSPVREDLTPHSQMAPHPLNKGLTILATPSIKIWMGLLEVAMGLYTLECARQSLLINRTIVSFPFLLLFAYGYLYVGFTSLYSQWLVRRQPQPWLTQPAA